MMIAQKTASKKQVDMVIHERPGITGCGGFLKKGSKTSDEFLSIPIILKDGRSLDASYNDVMKGTGSINAGLSGHDQRVTREETTVNI